jgi:hypothetical protein
MTDGVATTPPQLAREIARQGEARLAALMSLGTAADLRATALCGIFGAAAVAIGAAVLTSIATGHLIVPLIVGGAIVSIGLLSAAVILAHAAAPRDFYIAGGNPDILKEWLWDAGKWRSETEMLEATGDRFARSIAENHRNLELGSRRVRFALWVALATPLIGITAFCISSHI